MMMEKTMQSTKIDTRVSYLSIQLPDLIDMRGTARAQNAPALGLRKIQFHYVSINKIPNLSDEAKEIEQKTYAEDCDHAMEILQGIQGAVAEGVKSLRGEQNEWLFAIT
jgi:hypothetical protein